MSKMISITIKDSNINIIESIQKECESKNISFSAFTVDAIIEYSKKVLE